jgi:hypothetical protein
MKQIVLTLTALLAALTGFSQLQQVVAEPFEIGDPSAQPAGTTTYRVYAEFASATDKLSAVFAIDGCHDLSVATTTSFYNDEFGGVTAATISPALYASFPALEADSWVTISAENADATGASDIYTLANTGDPFTESFGFSGSGSSFALTDGAWFTLATSPAALPSGPMNRVLIGQFTTDGVLSFNLNLQVFVGGDQENGRVDYVWNTDCPEPTGFEEEVASLSQTIIEAVEGCTDTNALNFDPEANTDDGSCIIPDCADEPLTANYCYESIDATQLIYQAINIGEQVIIEFTAGSLESCCDDLLIYDGVGTDGTLLGVFTGDLAGVLLESQTGALTLAIDADGSVSCASGSQDEWAFNVYCGEPLVLGCTDPEALNFDPEATQDDGSCITPSCADANPEVVSYCYDNVVLESFTYVATEPGTEVVLEFVGGTLESCCDDITIYDGTSASGTVIAEITGVLSGQTFVSTAGAITILVNSDISNSCASGQQESIIYNVYCGELATPGCTDMNACNFNPAADIDDGSCVICDEGFCVDFSVIPGDFPEEIFYDVLDSDGNVVYSGTGESEPVTLCLPQGCYTIDMFDDWGDGWNDGALVVAIDGLPAGNFVLDLAPLGDGENSGQDFLDVGDSGDCPVFGCTDILACNFDPAATDDDGSCEFAEEFFDCDGNCLNDADDDGVCDELEVPGCTDPEACNFVAEATDDDGSCEFAEEFFDCDGNCLNDADDDGVCDELEVPGCTDPEACNFVAEATDDDGSCEYAEEFFDCDGNCLNDADDDGVCDELEVPGCTDPEACNFVAEATDDDGSCTYPEEDYLDCDGNCLNDADGDGICDELEIAGCTDPEACNYNAEATDDDGSCAYIEEFAITGEGNPVEGSTETYTYENTAGSSYDWTVTGGSIVSGQGTNEITVEWDTPGAGSVVVIETNEAGCVGPEVTFIVTIQEDVSVDEVLSIELNLWPNPANESITVEPGVTGLFELQILDATGREVFRTSINGRTVVPTSALSNGNYILRLTGTGAVATERFSVVR